jgi:hypothetical protein
MMLFDATTSFECLFNDGIACMRTFEAYYALHSLVEALILSFTSITDTERRCQAWSGAIPSQRKPIMTFISTWTV